MSDRDWGEKQTDKPILVVSEAVRDDSFVFQFRMKSLDLGETIKSLLPDGANDVVDVFECQPGVNLPKLIPHRTGRNTCVVRFLDLLEDAVLLLQESPCISQSRNSLRWERIAVAVCRRAADQTPGLMIATRSYQLNLVPTLDLLRPKWSKAGAGSLTTCTMASLLAALDARECDRARA